MLIVFCVERPSKEGAPLGWGIELRVEVLVASEVC